MLHSILFFILRIFSKSIIRKYKPDIIGVTGSAGKTSSKEAIAAVLRCRFNVGQSYKNYNNQIGMPLAIMGLGKSPGRSVWDWLRVFGRALRLIFLKDKHYPEILVLEMGADRPGDIEYLTNIAPCKAGVLTYISHAHTEFFKTIKKIAQEKRQIISHLQSDGYAVLNIDNELVAQSSRVTKAEIITYGFKEEADLRATEVNFILDEKTGWPKGLNFKVIYKGSVVPVFLPGAIAKPWIASALSGLAVGTAFGVNLVEAAQALEHLEPLPGHMRLIPGIKNTLLIDDSYNSSPDPTKVALEALAQIKVGEKGERYAVLGDMLELGPETEPAHREIGFKVAELGINYLITVGEASKDTAAAAREAGLEEHHAATFADSVLAGKFLQKKIQEGDVILVKGSQGSRMEKIVKEVMAEPLRAEELLVRQGREWQG